MFTSERNISNGLLIFFLTVYLSFWPHPVGECQTQGSSLDMQGKCFTHSLWHLPSSSLLSCYFQYFQTLKYEKQEEMKMFSPYYVEWWICRSWHIESHTNLISISKGRTQIFSSGLFWVGVECFPSGTQETWESARPVV